MASPLRMAGVLLCRVGNGRLAFAAQEVDTIASAPAAGAPACSARQAFGESPGATRLLLAPSGEAVGVDMLEIEAESHPLLPVPVLLRPMAGGCLRGFIQVRGALWPLVGLPELYRFLQRPEVP
jgi:hypothetical protein